MARASLSKSIKEGSDKVFAGLFLLLLSPLLMLIALAIRISSPGPALFRQLRLGYRGSTFGIFKFRTMVQGADKLGTGLYIDSESDPRITRIGRLLRSTHLDELPQLWNILIGQMSFVGPRPTVPYHFDYYETWEKRRLEMLPGLTGWAQINGANQLNWDDRIVLDVWYVDNWSLLLDLRILLRTAMHIALRALGLKKDTYTRRGPSWTRPRPDRIDRTVETEEP